MPALSDPFPDLQTLTLGLTSMFTTFELLRSIGER